LFFRVYSVETKVLKRTFFLFAGANQPNVTFDFESIPKDQEIALLLSGGVDSSVALGLLKNAGYNVKAYYLKIWLEDELTHLGSCPWQEDLDYARGVCEMYDVPLEVVSMQREYENQVIQYTLRELKSGGTPSPDLFCNSLIKFGAFAEKFKSRWIATGHYARAVHTFAEDGSQTSHLCKAQDPIKDQTYFLSQLSQSQLQKLIFPLGQLEKKRVRELASEWQLPNADRKDSQGICFLGKIPYREFVKHHLGEKQGSIVHRKTGEKVGDHAGSWFHTIGQRKGLGLSGGPWFVVEKDFDANIVYVDHDEEAKGTDSIVLAKFNWLTKPAPEVLAGRFDAKLRHGAQTVGCKVSESSDDPTRLSVALESADRGVATGQFCVLFHQNTCLGSGRIIV